MNFRKGQIVEWTDPKTHRIERGAYDHTARFGTGFVGAYCTTPAGRRVTVAVTKVRPAAEGAPQAIPAAQTSATAMEGKRGHPEAPGSPASKPTPNPAVPDGFRINRWGDIVPIPGTAAGDAAIDWLLAGEPPSTLFDDPEDGAP